jgi:uncharacterized protein (DUF433 family)
MNRDYVEQRDGGFWITGKRISLDSVVLAFQRGSSPENIKRSFPLLTLEEVYGAITFYLANQAEIDVYLRESHRQLEAEAELRRAELRKSNPELVERLEKARKDFEVLV